MRSYTCIVNMLINKNFLGLDDRYCLIEKFLCSHVATHMCCKYWHKQLPKSYKGTDSSGETLLQPTGNPRLKKCIISTQSYVYNEMIRLFPMKVPVKNYSDVDWFRQVKNTELTPSCIISCSWSWRTFFLLSKNCRCKRKTHWVNECTTRCVCVYTLTWSSKTTQFKQLLCFLWQPVGISKESVNSTSCFLKSGSIEFEKTG